ncbi:NAD(P)-dependent glycerol-1-phosphate dehydrogenase [Candidatus Bathyarchaeota archaeon]|nr:NAD(P)-dependent glycerol-1-phosphate dehydrogenase [Candidatus Bathyarchaeota archaeon]
MRLPREVVVGDGSLRLAADVCRSLGFLKSALVITGPKTIHVAGRRIIDLLQSEGLEVHCHIISSSSATLNDVKEAEEKIKAYQPQVVFGVGGGTKIDIAKLSSAYQNVPFISVPTTASHDSMASPFASIKGTGRPYSIKAQSPIAVIADTSIIMNAPYRFTASGCGDVISKITSTRDWKLAHEKREEYYAQYTSSLASMSAKHVIDNANIIKPGSEEGVRVLLEALVSCGVAMCIAGTSKPCSGSEHLFSHALDLIAPNHGLHGEQCGLGTIMMAALHEIDWEIVRDTLRMVGAPVSAEEIGIEDKYIVEALVKAREIRPERYTILNEKPLTRKSARQLAKKTGVIN